MATATLDANKLDLRQHITIQVKVRHLNWWQFKMRIALWLIWLACHIAKMGIEFPEE